MLAADGWQVFTIDARGHGDSDWAPDGDYGIDGFVADYYLVIDGIRELSRSNSAPVTIGASLGGATGLIGEGERRGVTRALILVDVVPRIELRGANRIGDFMRSAPSGFGSIEEVAEAVARYQPHRKQPSNLDGLRRNVREGLDGRLYWHWDPAFLLGGEAIVEGQRLHRRLTEAARHVAVPTLVVRGAMSDIVSDEGVSELKAALPAASVVGVAGAAHMVAGDDNAVFVEATRDFLRALPAVDP
jgi:pimeloyl-ACP methyl ester carboxylesterase